MRIYHLALASSLVAGSAVQAQQILSFQSYTEALDVLLAPSDFNGFSIDANRLSCPVLSQDINELDPNQTFTDFNSNQNSLNPMPTAGSLGPNLSRHCSAETNQPFGSSTTSGFSSPQSTRTFLSFGTDRRRATTSPPPDAANETAGRALTDFSLSGLTDLQSVGGALRFSIQYAQDTTQDTPFEAGSDGSSFGAFVGVEYPMVSGGFYGFGISIASAEGSVNTGLPLGDLGIGFVNSQQNLDDLQAYQNACATIQPGERDSEQISLVGYGQRRLSDRTALSFEASAGYVRQSYAGGLCIISFQDIAGPLFAGELSGAPRTLEFAGTLNLQTRMTLGRAQFYPGVGATLSHRRTRGYTETETPITSVASSLSAASTLTTVPTGAALIYDDQTHTALKMRLGGALVVPFSAPNATGEFFTELHYVSVLSGKSQTVTARFAEDFRDTPTRFSFQRNPLPSDYFEVGMGVQSTSRNGNVVTALGVRGVLGDSIRDNYGVFAQLRVVF